MAAAVARFDVVITTAQVPGRTPPVLVTAEALAAMRPGSVVVDLAASDLGGNVESARCRTRTVVTDDGVTVVGAGNLAAAVPRRGLHGVRAQRRRAAGPSGRATGAIVLDPADEITAGVLVTHDGRGRAPGRTRRF